MRRNNKQEEKKKNEQGKKWKGISDVKLYTVSFFPTAKTTLGKGLGDVPPQFILP